MEIKTYLKSLRSEVAHTQGKHFLYNHTKRIDGFVMQAYKEVLQEAFGQYMPMQNSIPIAVIAMGSYGREQLCVYSDIDIMIAYEEVAGYACESIVKALVVKLFDTGLKIGHRVHEISQLRQAARSDVTIKTAMLESRFIGGSNFVWTGVQNRLLQIRKEDQKTYIGAKIQEYRSRHKKYPLTVEPDIKNAPGGFRDANTVFWIAKALLGVDRIKDVGFDDKEYREFRKALEYLFRIRTALHIANGRKNDTLRFEDLGTVATLLQDDDSYKNKFKLVSKTLACLDIIHRQSLIWIDQLSSWLFFDATTIQRIHAQDRYIFTCGQYLLASKSKQGTLGVYVRALLQHPGAKLSPSFIGAAAKAGRDNKPLPKKDIFYSQNSCAILQGLHRCGQLAAVIQVMKKIMFMPQFDGYHHYAVDEHSLLTLQYLEQNDDAFLLSLQKNVSVDEWAMLKLTALLHDCGKGRKSDHSQVGARVYKTFSQKIGMPLTHKGVQLIKIHTFMSLTAQQEDIYDDTAVLKFLTYVGDKKTLDMLYLLTVADMKAVGPKTYNHFTKKLLRQLYERCLDLLDQDRALGEVAKRVKVEKKLLNFARFQSCPKLLQKKIFSISSNLFFQKLPLEKICTVSMQAENVQEYRFWIHNEQNLSIEVIRAKQFNIAYLLGRLKRLNVVDMDIYKLFDDKKYFKIDFFEKVEPFELAEVEKIIQDSFDMDKKPSLKPVTIYPKEVHIDCGHSNTVALMRLNCANQTGLLSHVASVFELFGIDIVSAKANTHKNRAKDLFLIQKSDKICNNIKKVIGSLCVE